MKTFANKPFAYPTTGLNAVSDILAANKNIFTVIARNNNGNVVVYEALLNDRKQLIGIDVYWLDLDPAFRRKARSQNRHTDRVALTKMDRFGYGMQVIRKKSPYIWKVKFQHFNQDMTIAIRNNDVNLYRRRRDGELSKVSSIFIKNRSILGGLPTVESLTIQKSTC